MAKMTTRLSREWLRGLAGSRELRPAARRICTIFGWIYQIGEETQGRGGTDLEPKIMV
jgi:hypothetical protein